MSNFFDESDESIIPEVVSAYTYYKKNRGQVINRESYLYKKKNIENGELVQLVYLTATDDGRKRIDYGLDPRQPSIRQHPIVLDVDDMIENFIVNKAMVIDEIAICTNLIDGIDIRENCLMPTLVCDNLDAILEWQPPYSMIINLWLKVDPKGPHRKKLIQIYEKYKNICETLEIAFYTGDIGDAKWVLMGSYEELEEEEYFYKRVIR